ncbi:ASKHA domain-containing protein [Pelagibius sp. Alg239-R121]|uniref:ASKHA domain-containing protein n=1 Tax=Pelagibius sp. Alg239-R121 TaxID=2993448 RepID=UPI0024A77287|nr:ASKHA domain-containing protein [Pelagibius sp. Alg239-R121]
MSEALEEASGATLEHQPAAAETDVTGTADKVAQEALVVFTPSGRRGHFAVGTPVLKAARSLGVDIDSVCGGRGICGRCQVQPEIGDFAKHGIQSRAENVSESNEVEARYSKKRGMKADRRLSCQSLIQGDLVVDVPADSQVHKQVVRKRAEVRDIELDPAMRLHYVEVEEPDMHNPTGDLERLIAALKGQWGLTDLECDLRTLQGLQQALRKGNWKVTVAVHRSQVITAIWPGFQGNAYGMAVDVGSTTIAAHLCDLQTGEVLASSGIMNPQIRFGEDLMSRVSYVMMNPGGDKAMTAAVRDALNALTEAVAEEAQIDRTHILNATFVGNPIMHHLLLGMDPTELGGAPFALAANSGMTLWATELELNINQDGRVYVLPCIAGHVGADTAGVILSEHPHLAEEITLVVDVGTNAEIVLGNKERLLACSSPTGPAFEGAQISCGQRAAPGAIERVRIDPETLEPRFRVIGSDLWSDEPGFALETKKTGVTGVCGSGIIEVLAEMFLAGILLTDGTINGAMAAKTPRIQPDGRTFSYLLHEGDGNGDGEPELRITQNDVRAIQLGKAALYAGIRLLMDRLDIEQVERIMLAGAFGSHIDVKYAMILGMIPDCPLDKVHSAGNAAGTGARIALLNQKSRDDIETVVKKVEKIETAVEAKFQDHFVQAMGIPHTTAVFPHLAAAVELPAPSVKAAPEGDDDGGRRRRRRRG